jgi:hypothetical protein
VRLRGVPATVSGAPGLRVKRRDLRLRCLDGQQTFVYREGSGAETFAWVSSCQHVSIRILVGGPSQPDREILREWNGPLAFPTFLRKGRPLGGGMYQWDFEGPEGIDVQARYVIQSGEEIRKIVHHSPPASLGS